MCKENYGDKSLYALDSKSRVQSFASSGTAHLDNIPKRNISPLRSGDRNNEEKQHRDDR